MSITSSEQSNPTKGNSHASKSVLRFFSRFRSTIVVLALSVLIFVYGPTLVFYANARWQLRKSPALWVTPKPLGSSSTDRPKGPKVTYFGYEFDSPFADVKELKKFNSVVIVSLSNCANIVLLKPDPTQDTIQILRHADEISGRSIDLFGADAMQSNYAFESKLLNLTPADVHLFSSRRELAGNSTLLMIKGIDSRFQNGLYSFTTPSMRGFQKGNLMHDKGVLIDAFDTQDRRLTLIVGRQPGKTCFGQTELNEIFFSLRSSDAKQPLM